MSDEREKRLEALRAWVRDQAARYGNLVASRGPIDNVNWLLAELDAAEARERETAGVLADMREDSPAYQRGVRDALAWVATNLEFDAESLKEWGYRETTYRGISEMLQGYAEWVRRLARGNTPEELTAAVARMGDPDSAAGKCRRPEGHEWERTSPWVLTCWHCEIFTLVVPPPPVERPDTPAHGPYAAEDIPGGSPVAVNADGSVRAIHPLSLPGDAALPG